MIRSFAKNKCEMPTFSRDPFDGFQTPSIHFYSIKWPRYSMHKMNKEGEGGSPYLSPIEGVNRSKAPPLNNIEILVVVMQLMITQMRF